MLNMVGLMKFSGLSEMLFCGCTHFFLVMELNPTKKPVLLTVEITRLNH